MISWKQKDTGRLDESFPSSSAPRSLFWGPIVKKPFPKKHPLWEWWQEVTSPEVYGCCNPGLRDGMEWKRNVCTLHMQIIQHVQNRTPRRPRSAKQMSAESAPSRALLLLQSRPSWWNGIQPWNEHSVCTKQHVWDTELRAARHCHMPHMQGYEWGADH